ncbi:uncharacterized protein LOC118442039 [Vespa mandarinia]|uniref:uncharacterized protein LOC118442039 n=1 Tax=Vespa mandarinia TaxID=7446 RepID=UPI00161CD398|nr:uncharacterized protein LOC118442039 [Vespa mandarinia]
MLGIFKGADRSVAAGIMSTITFVGNAFFYIITIFDDLTRKKEILDISTRVQATVVGKIITKFRFINNGFVYIIVIFAGISRRKWIKLFVKQLEICTREIDKLNVPKNYSSLFRYQCIIGVFVIFMIASQSIYLLSNTSAFTKS